MSTSGLSGADWAASNTSSTNASASLGETSPACPKRGQACARVSFWMRRKNLSVPSNTRTRLSALRFCCNFVALRTPRPAASFLCFARVERLVEEGVSFVAEQLRNGTLVRPQFHVERMDETLAA